MYDLKNCDNNSYFVSFIKEVFKGIKTKDGHDYSDHCITVANFAVNLLKEYEYLAKKLSVPYLFHLALCHDVIEDLSKDVHQQLFGKILTSYGNTSMYFLLEDYLTFDKTKQTRQEYIEKIAYSQDPRVMLVKMADLIHNSLISRGKSKPFNVDKEVARITKYMLEYNLIKTQLELLNVP